MTFKALRPFPVVLLLLAMSAAAALAGDVVVTTNGTRIEGKILSDDKDGVVIEKALAGGTTTITIPRAQVKSIERGATTAAPAPAPPKIDRDEWWLLESDGKIVGTRHVVIAFRGESGSSRPATSGYRLEEQIVLFPPSRHLPGVHVHRIEETDSVFRPTDLYYREVGDAGPADSGVLSYETIRSGPVADGVWKMEERVANGGSGRDLPCPLGTLGPLAVRERILRASPRVVGLQEVEVLDPGTGVSRRVKAGFASVAAAGTAPDDASDVLRWEDGGGAREGRFNGLTGVREDVAPGIVAVATTAARATAATEQVEPTTAGSTKREITLPDCGIALSLPGVSWTAVTPPPRPASDGRRVVATLSSRVHGAEVRVDWDPSAVTAEFAAPGASEKALLDRLRTVSPDLTVVEPRAAMPSLPGAWRLSLSHTLHDERVRTLVLVAERGTARVTVLATCSAAAFPDAREALESILASFRWL